MAERRFRVTNISASRGKLRTQIPLGSGVMLQPTNIGRRRYRRQEYHRSTTVIDEAKLRELVGFFWRGQMLVEAIDGQALPDFLEKNQGEPAAEPVPTPEPEPKPELEPEPEEDLSILDGNAKDIVALITEIDEEDELQALLEMEKEGANRKTVLRAIQEKLSGGEE